MTKNSQQTKNGSELLNLIKGNSEKKQNKTKQKNTKKPTANKILRGERLNAFPQRNNESMTAFNTPIEYCADSLANEQNKKKNEKAQNLERKK